MRDTGSPARLRALFLAAAAASLLSCSREPALSTGTNGYTQPVENATTRDRANLSATSAGA